MFAGLDAQVLGISVDHVPCLQAWAKSLGGISFPLLSDFWPHGKAAKTLGLFRQVEGSSQRANIILDETGRVVFVKVYPIAQLPDIEEILVFLKSSPRNK